MATSAADPGHGMRPLPQPQATATVLRIAAVLFIAGGMVTLFFIWAHSWFIGSEVLVLEYKLLCTAAAVGAIGVGFVFHAVALLAYYGYQTALNIRLSERQHLTQHVEPEAGKVSSAAASATFNHDAIGLLREINENTLLAEQDKARKRARLAEVRRQRMKTEIHQLISATKWPAARARIDEMRAEYPDDEEVSQLGRQLDAAVKEHQEIDIMTAGEQIRSYMSLGLWEKARAAAQHLAMKYPDNPDAQKMQNVVRLEEQSHQREDRLQLYREIEHLVARKHYRDAKRAADTLIQRYPDSPEAATLKGQMDELTRNADIEIRREMEAQIIEHTKQNRHREAYEIAKLLMEQYPESPQAVALHDQIDRLRERAGVT